MQVGEWEYGLPRYMRAVLEIAGLADGDYTIDEFIEKINRVAHDPGRDGELALFVNVAKLLFVEFARMAEPNEQIGLANIQYAAEAEDAGEKIDLVDRALPEPQITHP